MNLILYIKNNNQWIQCPQLSTLLLYSCKSNNISDKLIALNIQLCVYKKQSFRNFRLIFSSDKCMQNTINLQKLIFNKKYFFWSIWMALATLFDTYNFVIFNILKCAGKTDIFFFIRNTNWYLPAHLNIYICDNFYVVNNDPNTITMLHNKCFLSRMNISNFLISPATISWKNIPLFRKWFLITNIFFEASEWH